MDKKQKKSLRRHLLVIYIFYFLALAAGFIHSFVPHVSSSLATGWQGCVRRHSDAGKTRYRATHLLFGGPVAKRPERRNSFPDRNRTRIDLHRSRIYGVNIYVKTDENSDPTVVRTLNRINYILLLSIPALLAKLSILILVALIINILLQIGTGRTTPAGAYHHLHACRRVPADSGRSLHRESALIFTRVRPGRFSKIRPCKSPPRSRSTTGTSSWRFWYSSRPRSSRSDPG